MDNPTGQDIIRRLKSIMLEWPCYPVETARQAEALLCEIMEPQS